MNGAKRLIPALGRYQPLAPNADLPAGRRGQRPVEFDIVRAVKDDRPPPAPPDEDDPADRQPTPWEPEPVVLEIGDVLDLHSFPPRDVPNVVRDYLDAAYDEGLRELRIIHGRGVGVQRRTVRTLLERDPRVIDFGDAPLEAGGWGATWVRLQ